MISYAQKDIDAMAFIRPEFMTTTNSRFKSTDVLIAKARRERSLFIGNFIANLFAGKAETEDRGSVVNFPQPVLTSGVMDVDQLLVLARRQQALLLKSYISSAWNWGVKKMQERSKNKKAIRQLSAMSNRELADIGLVYSDIKVAVYGAPKTSKNLIAGTAKYVVGAVLKAVAGFNKWQKARAG